MKIDGTTLLIAVGAYLLISSKERRNVPIPPMFPTNQIPQGENTNSEKWQLVFTIFNSLLASGMSIYDAVQKSKQQAGITGIGCPSIYSACETHYV